jgi:preprotein translocase subunit SecG
MYGLLITIFVLVAILQTIVILLQASKGGGLAGSFGGGGMTSVLGSRGTATFLSKLTAGLATAFMVLSLILGLMKSGTGQSSSLIEQERQSRSSSPASIGVPLVSPESQPAPVAPPASNPAPAEGAGSGQQQPKQ